MDMNLWEAFHHTEKPKIIKGMRLNCSDPSQNYILGLDRTVTKIHPMDLVVYIDDKFIRNMLSLSFTQRTNERLTNEGSMTFSTPTWDNAQLHSFSDRGRHEIRVVRGNQIWIVTNVYWTSYTTTEASQYTQAEVSFMFSTIDLQTTVSEVVPRRKLDEGLPGLL